MSPDIQNAMAMARSTPITAPHTTSDPAQAKKLAQQFEGVFLSQFMGEMFEGISTDGEFDGGEGEGMFRSLEIDEFSKQMAAQGGIGLAPAIARELLKTQETAQ
jgi:peptidoglycan hydrolase FlgJ